MEQLPDSSLIELAKGGDQTAFAELYARYFDPVFDFVARMTRNRDEAADIAQDTFLKAMNALGGLQKGASFKSWIFTIARNTALNRIEKSSRIRPLTYENEDGEEIGFDVVDSDRFSDPEEAAQASAVASLVWEAAAGLDPKQLSLLDLHLRQGLDSGEIADVLGVTKNNGYVMLNRLKKAVEDSIGAFIMFKDGRQYCSELDAVLRRTDIRGMSPEARKVVEGHVARCPNCEERKKKLAPLAAFAAFGAIGSPVGAKAHILEGLLREWPGPASTGGGGGGSNPGANGNNPGGGSGGGGGGSVAGAAAGGDALPDRPTFGEKFGSGGLRKARVLVPALGGIAALLFGVLFLPQSPLALLKDNSSVSPASSDPILPGATATLPANVPAGAPSATPTQKPQTNTPAPGQTPPPVGTALQGGATSTSPPAKTNTSAPTPLKGTPTLTNTPEATSTGTNTPTATATRTNTPTVTPTPVTPSPTVCVPTLSAVPDVLSIAPAGQARFTVFNGTPCPTTFGVNPDVSWLDVSGGGFIGPQSSSIVEVSVNRGLPSASGTYTGNVLVDWNGTSLEVVIKVERPAPPNPAPVITNPIGSCASFGATSTFEANVTDDGSVASVVVTYTNANGAAATVTLSSPGGSHYSGTGGDARDGSNYQVVAKDNLGATSILPFRPSRSCFP